MLALILLTFARTQLKSYSVKMQYNEHSVVNQVFWPNFEQALKWFITLVQFSLSLQALWQNF